MYCMFYNHSRKLQWSALLGKRARTHFQKMYLRASWTSLRQIHTLNCGGAHLEEEKNSAPSPLEMSESTPFPRKKNPI